MSDPNSVPSVGDEGRGGLGRAGGAGGGGRAGEALVGALLPRPKTPGSKLVVDPGKP